MANDPIVPEGVSPEAPAAGCVPAGAGGPRIGEPAPAFTARSTTGPLRLVDYRGRWLILFSHPADFTPVCTSEFVALARAAERFAARDCALLALSVDSLFAHFAWLRLIRDETGLEIRFPVIEDPNMAIARAYGMMRDGDPDSAAVRATFFIDPAGMVRATTCYPASVGRSIPELLRTLDALQAVDGGQAAGGQAAGGGGGGLAPADWQAGDPLLPPLPTDIEQVYAARVPFALAGQRWPRGRADG